MATELIGGTTGHSAAAAPPPPTRATAPPESAARQIGASTAVPQGADATPPTLRDVREAVAKIEQVIGPNAQDLRFSIDEDTGTTVIKLIDTQTQTVLRQIPTVEAIEISKSLNKLQGLLVREKA